MQIELPWISSKLHAHAKGHWRSKATATKEARTDAMLTAKNLLNRKQIVRVESPASVTYRFYIPDMRQRDEANMIQACKPYIDGIADAGLILGDHWKVLSTAGVVVELCRENPRVVLEITPL
jgi:crossover junction endodeoxyribonuclease RusA